MIELIAAAIAGLAAGAVIGGAVTAWVLCRRNKPAKLLTVGSLSVTTAGCTKSNGLQPTTTTKPSPISVMKHGST